MCPISVKNKKTETIKVFILVQHSWMARLPLYSFWSPERLNCSSCQFSFCWFDSGDFFKFCPWPKKNNNKKNKNNNQCSFKRLRIFFFFFFFFFFLLPSESWWVSSVIFMDKAETETHKEETGRQAGRERDRQTNRQTDRDRSREKRRGEGVIERNRLRNDRL